MMALAAFALSFAGLAALALSLARHHRDLFGRPPARSTQLALRGTGWTLLASSVAAAVRHAGISMGWVLWFGLATAATMAVALLLTYRARR